MKDKTLDLQKMFVYKYTNDENCCQVKDHWHYTGTFIGV